MTSAPEYHEIENNGQFGRVDDDTQGRHRCFWFTDNAITGDQWLDFNGLNNTINTIYNTHSGRLRYVIVAQDVAPSTGKKHIHGLVYFDCAKSRRALETFNFPRADQYHLVFPITDNHRINCINYCKTKSAWFEIGTAPVPASEARQRGGETTKKKWTDALDAAKRGRYEDIPADILIKHTMNLQRVQAMFTNGKQIEGGKDILKKHMFWFIGEPGTCKSRSARALARVLDPTQAPYIFLNASLSWWDNYMGEKVVIVDEMPMNLDRSARANWKAWTDIFPFKAQFKGGTFNNIRPQYIIICSNYTLQQVFGHENRILGTMDWSIDCEAMDRRLTQLEFSEKDLDDITVTKKMETFARSLGFISPDHPPDIVRSQRTLRDCRDKRISIVLLLLCR